MLFLLQAMKSAYCRMNQYNRCKLITPGRWLFWGLLKIELTMIWSQNFQTNLAVVYHVSKKKILRMYSELNIIFLIVPKTDLNLDILSLILHDYIFRFIIKFWGHFFYQRYLDNQKLIKELHGMNSIFLESQALPVHFLTVSYEQSISFSKL